MIRHYRHPDVEFSLRQEDLADEAYYARLEERATRHAPAPGPDVVALVDRVLRVTLRCQCGATLEVARDFAPDECRMCGGAF